MLRTALLSFVIFFGGLIKFCEPRAMNHVIPKGWHGSRTMRFTRVDLRRNNHSASNPFNVQWGNITTVLVFVNKKSGGKKGVSVLKAIRAVLPAKQVCDLSCTDPKLKLSEFKDRSSNLKIICCGGDGTVGWIVKALFECNMSHIPIGVVPLGTGNDLVRSLSVVKGGTSKVVTPEDLCRDPNHALQTFENPHFCEVDTWDMTVAPVPRVKKRKLHIPGLSAFRTRVGLRVRPRFLSQETRSAGPTPREDYHYLRRYRATSGRGMRRWLRKSSWRRIQRPPSSQNVSQLMMINYFSIGVDGVVTMAFHRMRNSYPNLFVSSFVNKMWYALLGLWTFIASPRLSLSAPSSKQPTVVDKPLQIVCDGVPVDIPEGVESVVVLNVDSYAGGMKLWRADKSRKVPSANDGLLEVCVR